MRVSMNSNTLSSLVTKNFIYPIKWRNNMESVRYTVYDVKTLNVADEIEMPKLSIMIKFFPNHLHRSKPN